MFIMRLSREEELSMMISNQPMTEGIEAERNDTSNEDNFVEF